MPTKRKKILVLDTDADRLIVIEQMCEHAGYETTTTWDIRIARELLASDGFDLVLIGEHPPEISCSDILDAVWSKYPAIPCIVLRSSRCALDAVVEQVKDCLRPTAEADCAEAKCVSAA